MTKRKLHFYKRDQKYIMYCRICLKPICEVNQVLLKYFLVILVF